MKRYKKNWIFIGVFFLVLIGSYFLFTEKILVYLCEDEGNAPACYLLADYYKDRLDISKYNRYLEISCEKKYEYACTKIQAK